MLIACCWFVIADCLLVPIADCWLFAVDPLLIADCLLLISCSLLIAHSDCSSWCSIANAQLLLADCSLLIPCPECSLPIAHCYWFVADCWLLVVYSLLIAGCLLVPIARCWFSLLIVRCSLLSLLIARPDARLLIAPCWFRALDACCCLFMARCSLRFIRCLLLIPIVDPLVLSLRHKSPPESRRVCQHDPFVQKIYVDNNWYSPTVFVRMAGEFLQPISFVFHCHEAF